MVIYFAVIADEIDLAINGFKRLSAEILSGLAMRNCFLCVLSLATAVMAVNLEWGSLRWQSGGSEFQQIAGGSVSTVYLD